VVRCSPQAKAKAEGYGAVDFLGKPTLSEFCRQATQSLRFRSNSGADKNRPRWVRSEPDGNNDHPLWFGGLVAVGKRQYADERAPVSERKQTGSFSPSTLPVDIALTATGEIRMLA
jgi:hypothetical protein